MAGESPLHGLRVLVVEDEALIALDLQQTLSDLGCSVVILQHPGPGLQALIAEKPIDAAVLDLDLAGVPSYGVADALAALGIPFIFATGYDNAAEGYRHVPLIEKPYSSDELVAAMQLAMQQWKAPK